MSSYDAAAWAKLDAAGCVFLPAAGYRKGNVLYRDKTHGYYWSSSKHTNKLAYNVLFDSSGIDRSHEDNHFIGASVRLVREAE